MKPLVQILCILSVLILAPVLAQDKSAAANPQPPIPEPPTIVSLAHLLVDHNTGKVLIEHQADERLDPASLTKIMTAYVVIRELAAGKVALTDEVLISEKAWRTGGSKTFVELGKQIPLEVLLHGMIIQSGNDASVALAEHVAGCDVDVFKIYRCPRSDHRRRGIQTLCIHGPCSAECMIDIDPEKPHTLGCCWHPYTCRCRSDRSAAGTLQRCT